METQATTAPVVSLDNHKLNTQARIELDGVRRPLSMLSWDLQAQQVVGFCGLTISEALLADEVPLPPSSYPAQLGHATLKDLVARSDSENGLSLDWADFSTKLMALVNRQKYAIQERDYREINALVEDASKILGRKPVDVAEYHSAKERAMQEQIATVQRESQMRQQDLQDKNANLMRSLTEAQAEIGNLHNQTQKLMQESAERISSMTREMALNQEVFERKANERVESEAKRLKAEFDQQLLQRQEEVGAMARDAESRRLQAEQRFSEIQARVDRGELIDQEMLRNAERQLEDSRTAETNLRNQLIDLNNALTDAQKLNQILREENADLKTQIEMLNGNVNNLELRLRDIIEDKLGSSEFAVLQERMGLLRGENKSLQEEVARLLLNNERQARSLSELRGRFQQMRQVGREHLQSLNEQLSSNQDRFVNLTTNLSQTKIMLGVMTGITMISTAGFALKSFGVF